MSKKQICPDPSYFIENRSRFLNRLPDHTVTILFSGTSQRKTADQNYPFEGNHNFYYLTGIKEEGAVLAIKKEDGKILRLILFVRTYDAFAERWTGIRITREEASAVSGIYDVSYSEGFDGTIRSLLTDWKGAVCIDKDAVTGADVWFSGFLEENYPTLEIYDVFPIFSELRRIKSPYEVSLIRKAIEATHEGILRIYETARPGMAEYELAAEFAWTLAKRGLGEPSFPSIVAAGKNFNYLHYPQLDTVVEPGDLVLMDLGAFYGGLSSDISRVFPIDGKFTEKQRAIYEVVRACQNKAFEMIRPGAYNKDVNSACKKIAGEMLSALGLPVKTDGEDAYYWHNVSHHLGLDVHDICGRDVRFEEGMVLTVEPGVYVPEWNVGLRIEDDVLVTSEGCEILSDFVPREADEIEALVLKNR